MRYFVTVFMALAFSSIGFSDTIIVPDDYPTIQGAIDAAVNGDTVLVKPGTYVENIDFKGKAITVEGDSGPDVTVIDGNQAGSVVTCQSSEGSDSVLDGFTITNGIASSGGGMYNSNSKPRVTNCAFIGNSTTGSHGHGGGMYNTNSNPAVTNCAFISNSTTGSDARGGGMYNANKSRPRVTSCAFIGNSTTGSHGYGGGMKNNKSGPTVTNCTFSGNSAGVYGSGGGMSNSICIPTVTNCTFIRNKAGYQGGGMRNWDSSPTVTYCTFLENMAGYGGGMSNEDYPSAPPGCNPVVTNCTFSGNSADDVEGGGGMYNVGSCSIVTNCTFSGNSASGGGGMSNIASSHATVTNCAFIGNKAGYWGGGGMILSCSKSKVINTIFWNNDAPEGPEIYIGMEKPWSSTLTISYSDVKGGKSSIYVYPGSTLNWGAGMIDSDPLFVDEARDDFHLTFNSPCKDTGDNTAISELYDFEGDPRIAYGTVDMGVDEFYTHLYWTGETTPGGNVTLKIVGLPGTTPVQLWLGSGVLDPPWPTKYGDWYLQFPLLATIPNLGAIPSNGVLPFPFTFPPDTPTPLTLPFQAGIGLELTNLSLMEVE